MHTINGESFAGLNFHGIHMHIMPYIDFCGNTFMVQDQPGSLLKGKLLLQIYIFLSQCVGRSKKAAK